MSEHQAIEQWETEHAHSEWAEVGHSRRRSLHTTTGA
jgi:hypothetical protein